jgi:hypothetical protein
MLAEGLFFRAATHQRQMQFERISPERFVSESVLSENLAALREKDGVVPTTRAVKVPALKYRQLCQEMGTAPGRMPQGWVFS